MSTFFRGRTRLLVVLTAVLGAFAGAACGDSGQSGGAEAAAYTGLWCGVGAAVPDSGDWCLLVCGNDRAAYGDQFDANAAEPPSHYLRYTYDGEMLSLRYKDGFEIVLGFSTSDDSGTITQPDGTAFDVERAGKSHGLCESETATQYETPHS